jgi:hypothetical protein
MFLFVPRSILDARGGLITQRRVFNELVSFARMLENQSRTVSNRRVTLAGRVSLDAAVNTSPFLTDAQRERMMTVPVIVLARWSFLPLFVLTCLTRILASGHETRTDMGKRVFHFDVYGDRRNFNSNPFCDNVGIDRYWFGCLNEDAMTESHFERETEISHIGPAIWLRLLY